MKCPACFFNNRRGATECSSCGVAMFAKDRKQQGIYDQSADKRKHTEDLFTARYEQRRYDLMPQQEGESDAVFCDRINRQKTPAVLAENDRKLAKLPALPPNPGMADLIPREPGQDG